MCVLDLLAALVRSANVATVHCIFTAVHCWFKSEEQQLQKKAFRILEEIFKRYDDPALKEFFAEFEEEIDNIIEQVYFIL